VTPKWVSRVLVLIGILFAALSLGINEYYMVVQRLHIELLLPSGLIWGLSFILPGVLYALTPSRLAKALMGGLMALANVGFLFALWVLFNAIGTSYYQYLCFIEWVLLPTWLVVNTLGAYYLIKTTK